MKLIEIKKIEGKIILKSGLHIGSGNMEMHIGGTDNPVIKHPHTLEPYIPGSSLKGKVRSLLELKSGLMGPTEGKVTTTSTLKKNNLNEKEKKECEKILKIFGSSGADKEDESNLGPTRVSFSDCFLNNKWREKAKENRLLITEVKSENVIDRITGTAKHPRFFERVVAGTEFDFLITFKKFDEDEDDLFDYLLQGLKLLEMDALGGSGSRGYGRIQFEFNDEQIKKKFDEIKFE
jgi:CRISPR-associated protein Csm3